MVVMMTKWAQLDGQTVTAILEAETAPDVLPEGRTFVKIPEGIDVVLLGTYDATEKTFTPPSGGDPFVALIDRAVDAVLDQFDIAGLKASDVVAAKAAALAAAKQR